MTATELAWDLDVFVPGKPAPKGSTKGFHRGGRVIITADNGPDQRDWSSRVRDAVGRAWRLDDVEFDAPREAWEYGPTARPVHVVVDFVMPRRASAPKRRTDPHVRKPDGDKLTRCVWDALTHIVWVDDAQVVSWAGGKREAEIGETPGARIRVALLPERNGS